MDNRVGVKEEGERKRTRKGRKGRKGRGERVLSYIQSGYV